MRICKVQATLLSGVDCFVLTKSEIAVLDRKLMKYDRIAMRGKAHKCVIQGYGSVKHVIISNFEVLRYWRLVPCGLELVVKRLTRLRAWSLDPAWHVQVISG